MISCDPAHPPELTALWDQYSRRLLAFLRSKVSDEADAEDLLQDVFLRIHTNLCYLRDVCRLESWVFQITRNAVIDYYRSRKVVEELPETMAFDQELPGDDLEAELAPSLRELVESLPEPYREALILTEYQGMSQKNMASRLGISIKRMPALKWASFLCFCVLFGEAASTKDETILNLEERHGIHLNPRFRHNR